MPFSVQDFARSNVGNTSRMNVARFSGTVLDSLAAAGIRIGFTRDLRENLIGPAGSKAADLARGTTSFENLLNFDPRVLRREVVNWNIMEHETEWGMHYLPDEQTSVHLTRLYDDKSGTFYCNLVSPRTRDYFASPGSRIYRFIEGREFSNISVHLGFSCEEITPNPAYGCLMPLSPILAVEEIKSRQVNTLRTLASNFGRVGCHTKLLVENLDFDRFAINRGVQNSAVYEWDPKYISDVVRQAGCGVLIDTAHALVTANSRGVSGADYVADIAERVGIQNIEEVHVVVPKQEGEHIYDEHSCLYANPGSATALGVLNIIRFLVEQGRPINFNFETPVPTVHLDAIMLVLFLRELMGF